MDAEPLKAIREEAEALEPPMRAASLMRIARVLTASDREAAREMFDCALEAARSVTGHEGEDLLEDAQMYAAAIAPERVREIPVGSSPLGEDRLYWRAGETMIQHGNFDAALELMLHLGESSSRRLPSTFVLVNQLDSERQLVFLRWSIEAWRQGRMEGWRGALSSGGTFLDLFRSKWNLLPPEEARTVAHEIVGVAMKESDQPITITATPRGPTGRPDEVQGLSRTVETMSKRENMLLQVLHVLRVVDPPLAESLVCGHARLAKAEIERREFEAAAGKRAGIKWYMERQDFLDALQRASESGDFLPALALAAKEYGRDSAPERLNASLKASWPSCCMYCTVFYQAGRRLGEAARSYLDQIPDPDQRFLARIELAAAVAGLPEFRQMERRFVPRPALIRSVN